MKKLRIITLLFIAIPISTFAQLDMSIFMSNCVKSMQEMYKDTPEKSYKMRIENYCKCGLENVWSKLDLKEIEKKIKNNTYSHEYGISLILKDDALSFQYFKCFEENIGIDYSDKSKIELVKGYEKLHKNFLLKQCAYDMIKTIKMDKEMQSIFSNETKINNYCACYIGELYSGKYTYGDIKEGSVTTGSIDLENKMIQCLISELE